METNLHKCQAAFIESNAIYGDFLSRIDSKSKLN